METQTNLDSHDLRLNVYFQNKRIREHLIRAGLINRKGVILPAARKDKPKIPPAISNYMLDEDRKRRRFIQNYFDLAARRERVQQIRESKQPRSRPKSLSFFDATTDDSNIRKTRTRSQHRVTSSRTLQLTAKNLLPTRPTTAKSRISDDNCKVILIYYGPPNNDEQKAKEADEILIMQQHNGGENLPVFKGFVKPNQTFHFQSHRHPDYPFALSIYINGLFDTRISVCCEYKHKHNVRLGSKYGLFGIVDVKKSKPCTMCRFEQRRKEILAKSAVSPYLRSTLTTEFSPNFMLRTPVVTPEKKSPKKVNRISTLARASETSRVSPDDDDEKLPNISINTEPVRKTSTSTSSSSTPFSKKLDPHHSSEPILSKRYNDTDKSSSTLLSDESDNEKQKVKSRTPSDRSTPTPTRQRSSSSSDRSLSLNLNNNNKQNHVQSRSSSSSDSIQELAEQNRRSISNDSFKFTEDKPHSQPTSNKNEQNHVQSRGSSSSSIHSNKNEQNHVQSRSSSRSSNSIQSFTHNDRHSVSNKPIEDKPPSRPPSKQSIHSRSKSPSISNNSLKMGIDTIYNRRLTKTSMEKSDSEHSRTSPSANTFKLLADLVPARPDSGTPSERSSSSTSIHLPTKDNLSHSSSNSTLKNNDELKPVRKTSLSDSDDEEEEEEEQEKQKSITKQKLESDDEFI